MNNQILINSLAKHGWYANPIIGKSNEFEIKTIEDDELVIDDYIIQGDMVIDLFDGMQTPIATFADQLAVQLQTVKQNKLSR